jgi:maleate isomerase
MPALLGRHPAAAFWFGSTRMRMHTVSPEQLRAMNGQRERCVDETGDAGALMAQGPQAGPAST